MQIHDNRLITECTSYDFKEMQERKKVKSWLKSVSAFANTEGGSLFYGVNDEGEIVGLKNVQADADFISERQGLTLYRKYNLSRLNTKDALCLKSK